MVRKVHVPAGLASTYASNAVNRNTLSKVSMSRPALRTDYIADNRTNSLDKERSLSPAYGSKGADIEGYTPDRGATVRTIQEYS